MQAANTKFDTTRPRALISLAEVDFLHALARQKYLSERQ